MPCICLLFHELFKIEFEISLLTVIQFYSNIDEKRVGKSLQEISTKVEIYLLT